MFNKTPTAPLTLADAFLSHNADLIREGLSGRLGVPTFGQGRRLTKVLERLQPVATLALTQVVAGKTANDLSIEFSSLLRDLADA